MESWQWFWQGVGITLLLLPVIQWYYCRVARQHVEEHVKTGGRVRLPNGRDSEPRPLDKEDIDEAIELKFSHWIIGVPVFVGFWLTLFFFVIPLIRGDF